LLTVIAYIVAVLSGAIMLALVYRKAAPHEALVRTGLGGLKVTFNYMFMLPIIHRTEKISLASQNLLIKLQGRKGVTCKNTLKADIVLSVFISINRNVRDIALIAKTIGCENALSTATLNERFALQFTEVLKVVAQKYNMQEISTKNQAFKLDLIAAFNIAEHGYHLDDIVIHSVRQTALNYLDPNDICDVVAIRLITEQTAKEKISANTLHIETKEQIAQQNYRHLQKLLQIEHDTALLQQAHNKQLATIQH